MRAGSLAVLLAVIPSVAGAQDLTGEIKDLNWIGFQQFQEASRVFVRTTEPVKFSVDTSRDNMVVLTLENTRVPLRNNRRPLITKHFDSPIVSIVPKVIEGPSQSVRIEIYMRNKVPFRQVQNDNVLSLFFERVPR